MHRRADATQSITVALLIRGEVLHLIVLDYFGPLVAAEVFAPLGDAKEGLPIAQGVCLANRVVEEV